MLLYVPHVPPVVPTDNVLVTPPKVTSYLEIQEPSVLLYVAAALLIVTFNWLNDCTNHPPAAVCPVTDVTEDVAS